MTTLLLLIACGGKDDEVVDTGPVLAGPELAHTPPADVAEGAPLELVVTAADTDGLATVSLYHRAADGAPWELTPMSPSAEGTYSATLEGADVAAPSVQYYFKAVDAGETPASSYLPEDSTSAPFTVGVRVQGVPAPFIEDFELDEGQVAITDLGWANASEGFRGYGWDISSRTANGGATSAYHSLGYSGTGDMDDWLISPAIDLSALADAQVTWWEYVTNPDTATHGLYVSTGSRDPADGDWAPVAELLPSASSDGFGRSAVYDLSAWAGQPAVYLAWRYQGESADEWFIDDVRVEALSAILEPTVAVSPAPIGPGESGTLTVSLSNVGQVASGDVTVTVSFPEGGASVVESSAVIAPVDASGSGQADFSLLVDPSTADNRTLPVEVTVDDGGLVTVTGAEILIGERSEAYFSFTPWETGSVTVSLGSGDPEAPDHEEIIWSGSASAAVSATVDITDQWPLLPPVPGVGGRWYLRVDPSVDGFVDAFTIRWDGQDIAAEVLPYAPGGEETIVYLPSPPDYTATLATVPGTLSPGSSSVYLQGTVSNLGAASQGSVLATLASTDPDVTVVDGGPLVLTADAFGGGSSVSLSGFSFDVSAAHVDSTDVTLELTLTDEVESYTLPLSFDVPYAVLRVSGIEIDDDGRDGILDADESAELELQLTNGGDLTTTGAVYGSLSVDTSTSTATATVSTNTESYGTIGAGSPKDPSDPWEVTVTGGAAGDTLDLVLTLNDSARSYGPLRTQLILGEPPWQALDGSDDDVGDALDGWSFDLVRGRWRVTGDTLQLELTSDTVFDPDALFVEAWGYSSGADWSYYRLVLQSGVVSMQGYGSSGFVDISEPVVSYPDAYTVRFDLALTDMGLLVDQLALGIATGWCGPPDYYCDHYPNGWGYPYDSWNPTAFFDLGW
jgi:hypothetical protein